MPTWMNWFLNSAISIPLLGKLVCAALGIVAIHLLFQLLERRLPGHFHQRDLRYRARKAIVFAGYLVGIGFITILFEDRLGKVSFALGVAGAGLVVALQDVIASVAGWFAVGWTNLYRVGDRVQIGETRGDVIDVSLMRTTVVETGGWVNDDLYNGRVVRIPNSVVLKGTIFNYSQGFRFVWDEIRVKFSLCSDPQLARETLLRIANEATEGYIAMAALSWRGVTENFRIEDVSLKPTVALSVKGKALELTLSYIVDYTKRTLMKDRLYSNLVLEVGRSQGHLRWAATSSESHSANVLS
jgi:small-conductance mechanosensitive channel